MTSRQIKQGLQFQGEDEQIAYRLDTANWSADPSAPATPSNVSAKIYTVTDSNGVVTYTDVTSSKMTGSATVSGQYIQLPYIVSLAAGTRYRVEVKFTLEGSIFEAYAEIQGER